MFLIIVNIFIFFKIRSSNSFPSKLGILSTPYKHNFALHYKLYLQYEINKQEPRTYYGPVLSVYEIRPWYNTNRI